MQRLAALLTALTACSSPPSLSLMCGREFTHAVEAPAGQCALLVDHDGGMRFRREGDDGCGQACVRLQPGEVAQAFAPVQSGGAESWDLFFGECAELAHC
jgi:hypothetical protein